MVPAFNCQAVVPFFGVNTDKDGYIEVSSDTKNKLVSFDLILFGNVYRTTYEMKEPQPTIF